MKKIDFKNFNTKKFWNVFSYIFGWFSDIESIVVGVAIIYTTLIYSYNTLIEGKEIYVTNISNMLLHINGLESLVYLIRISVLIYALTFRIFSYFSKNRIAFSLITNMLYLYCNITLLNHLDLTNAFTYILLYLSILYVINTGFIIVDLGKKYLKIILKRG